jgi:hypothetical protein
MVSHKSKAPPCDVAQGELSRKDARKWGAQREEEKLLGRFVEFCPVFRLYGEGRATAASEA